ncbi:MAG: hypothetical protein OEU49_06445 [Chromatiales bacterium]|nr:hypothetical protein [Chromatiales bacterium]
MTTESAAGQPLRARWAQCLDAAPAAVTTGPGIQPTPIRTSVVPGQHRGMLAAVDVSETGASGPGAAGTRD